MLTISKKNWTANTNKLSIVVIAIVLFAFAPPAKNHSAQVHIIANDTIIPVLQKVYIVSPDETQFIKLEDLRSAKELKIEDSKEGFRILSFRITIDDSGYDFGEIINAGSRFNDKLIDALGKIKIKYFITIEDIQLLSKTGQKARAYPKIITVN